MAPLELRGHKKISNIYLRASKKGIFFSGQALTPHPLLVAGPLKKTAIFLRLPLPNLQLDPNFNEGEDPDPDPIITNSYGDFKIRKGILFFKMAIANGFIWFLTKPSLQPDPDSRK